jgi:hypothetical protein
LFDKKINYYQKKHYNIYTQKLVPPRFADIQSILKWYYILIYIQSSSCHYYSLLFVYHYQIMSQEHQHGAVSREEILIWCVKYDIERSCSSRIDTQHKLFGVCYGLKGVSECCSTHIPILMEPRHSHCCITVD